MSRTDFVQSLARGLDVIRTFAEIGEEEADSVDITLLPGDIAARTGMTRGTVRRLLLTLTELGYVRQDDHGFALSPKVLELGYSYFASSRLPQLIHPVLAGISSRLGESSSASVLEGGNIRYIARAHTHKIMRVDIAVGTRFPAFATAMGRVQLAQLPDEQLEQMLPPLMPALTPYTITDLGQLGEQLSRARATGYCVVQHELEVGLRSVAVPVSLPDGGLAAVNVASAVPLGPGPAEDPDLEGIVEELRRGAAEIERAAGRLR